MVKAKEMRVIFMAFLQCWSSAKGNAGILADSGARARFWDSVPKLILGFNMLDGMCSDLSKHLYRNILKPRQKILRVGKLFKKSIERGIAWGFGQKVGIVRYYHGKIIVGPQVLGFQNLHYRHDQESIVQKGGE